MRKRTAAILTALALLLSLGACGRNNTDSPVESAPPAAEVSAPALPEAAETETPVFGANLQGEGGGRFFSPQDIALPEEGLQFINCARAGDSIWMYDYESAQSSRLYRLDLNTLDISKIDGQWGKIEAVAGDSDGSGAVLSEMEDGSRRLSLIGADGSVSALRLPELGEAYFSSLCICPGGYLLEGTDALIALDGEGQVRKRFNKNGNGLAAVHSGDKTAEQAAKLIQSKASIYMSEQFG